MHEKILSYIAALFRKSATYSKGVVLADLQQIALTMVIIGVLAGVGVLITSQFESSAGVRPALGNDSSPQASWALNNTTLAITNLTARLPLIGTIAGFIVLLGFVLVLLVQRGKNKE